MTESMRKVEHKKRQLEDNLDCLNEECAQLKAQRTASIFLTLEGRFDLRALMLLQSVDLVFYF